MAWNLSPFDWPQIRSLICWQGKHGYSSKKRKENVRCRLQLSISIQLSQRSTLLFLMDLVGDKVHCTNLYLLWQFFQTGCGLLIFTWKSDSDSCYFYFHLDLPHRQHWDVFLESHLECVFFNTWSPSIFTREICSSYLLSFLQKIFVDSWAA